MSFTMSGTSTLDTLDLVVNYGSYKEFTWMYINKELLKSKIVMLSAGMDVSGSPNIGNYTYMSIVIGTDKILKQTIDRIGRNDTHMSQIKNKTKRSYFTNTF